MTNTMTVTEALAEYDANAYGQGNFLAGQHLADAVRAELAKPSDAAELAAEADRAARTMAPPVPGVTVNGGYTVQAVMPGHPAGNGLLESWWVACRESVSGGHWVTWEACRLDHPGHEGQLVYNADHYFPDPDGAVNRRAALADLAIRAGTMPEMSRRIADEIVRYHPEHGPYTASQREDRRMANRLRKWA